MPKPWPITSLRGQAGLSDDSVDPRGDPPEPVADNFPDLSDWPEPSYVTLAIANVRAQAAAVTGPKGDELRECIEAAALMSSAARLES